MIAFAEGLRRLLAGTAPDGSPVAMYRTDLQGLGDATDSFYSPCRTGLHLCGATDDGDQPTTMGNWELSPADARLAFKWIADRLDEVPVEQADFILDLQVNDDCDDGLACNRQQLVALLCKCEAEGV
jgi:hypothetical protein